MEVMSSNQSVLGNESGFDERAKEAAEFDQTKSGVKGLIDAGVAKIPNIFIHPPESRPDPSRDTSTEHLQIPVINLDGMDGGRRSEIVSEIREAAGVWGFFQIVNHGVPTSVMNGLLGSVRRFHEQPSEVKKEFYSRDESQRVKYYSTATLHTNQTAHWRDSISIDFEDSIADPQGLPPVCREAFLEYVSNMVKLRNTLSGLLSEALDLGSEYLASIECMETQRLVCHYYPPCPQPDLTLGITRHSDPYFLTILLQDSVGGLQVLHDNRWVNVPPMAGAFVINLGDFMQLVTNDKFKSVEHRVVAAKVGPRLSSACFLFPSAKNNEKTYGPIRELLSEEKPQLYRDTNPTEYFDHYMSKGLDGTRGLPHFRL